MKQETMQVLLWWKITVYAKMMAPSQVLLLGALYRTSFLDIKQDMVNTVMTKARAKIRDTEPTTTRLEASHNSKHHEAVQQTARQEVASVMEAIQVELQQRVETMQEPALVTEAIMAIANIAAHVP